MAAEMISGAILNCLEELFFRALRLLEFHRRLAASFVAKSEQNLIYGCRQVESDGIWDEVNSEGYKELQRACKDGDCTMVKRIIETNRELCLIGDADGNTPLHTAVMTGRVDVVTILLNACPESVKKVTPTGETCLHIGVVYNKGKSVQYLVKWLAQTPRYTYLINAKDHDGNTALHLATSRKQLQTLKTFLTCNPSINKLVDVNATKSGGITPLDILYVLPYGGKIDMEIDKILRRAGALRATDLENHDIFREWCKSSHINKIGDIIKLKREIRDAMLVFATLITAVTFHMSLNFLTPLYKEGYMSNQDVHGTSQMQQKGVLFLLFSLIVFIVSVITIIALVLEFPLKPWLQISVFMLFFTYMCLVISPLEAPLMLILSIICCRQLQEQRYHVSSLSGEHGNTCVI